jgi:protein-S-isoprenylcysteine O-methyltransferase Ste14
MPARFITLCWVIFVIYWMISAQSVKPVAERKSRFSSLAHRVPLGFGYFLLVWHKPGRWLSPSTPPALPWIGFVICLLGLLGTIWARKTLAGNWSSDVTFKQDHQLIVQGPYRFVRHPIYTTLLLMCLGTAIAKNQMEGYAGLLLFLAAFWIKLKQEEEILTRHFPVDYPAYKRRVKALIPFVL